jgi:hypothetical protein
MVMWAQGIIPSLATVPSAQLGGCVTTSSTASRPAAPSIGGAINDTPLTCQHQGAQDHTHLILHHICDGECTADCGRKLKLRLQQSAFSVG